MNRWTSTIHTKIVGTRMVLYHFARRVKMVDLKVKVSFSKLTAETTPVIYPLPFPHHSMLGEYT